MKVEFIDKTTIKEIKKQAEWHRKTYKKLMNIYLSDFSKSERCKAINCTPGEATHCLTGMILFYLSKHPVKDENYHYVNRPSFETLSKFTKNNIFNNVEKEYFNKYFAKQWIKDNYNYIVKVFFIKEK